MARVPVDFSPFSYSSKVGGCDPLVMPGELPWLLESVTKHQGLTSFGDRFASFGTNVHTNSLFVNEVLQLTQISG